MARTKGRSRGISSVLKAEMASIEAEMSRYQKELEGMKSSQAVDYLLMKIHHLLQCNRTQKEVGTWYLERIYHLEAREVELERIITKKKTKLPPDDWTREPMTESKPEETWY